MFRQFKLLFVDDLLHVRLSKFMKDEIGTYGEYADWESLSSATEAIQRFEQGDNIPDLALIDMMFGGAEDEAYVGPDPMVRGLFVATALQHHSHKCARYVIYTAQPKVKDELRFFMQLPPRLRADPLVKIVSKADPKIPDLEAVRLWTKMELRELARQEIRMRGVPLAHLEELMDLLSELERDWKPVTQAMSDDFQQIVRLQIEALLGWWGQAREQGELDDSEFLPFWQLSHARTCGEVVYAIDKATGRHVRTRIQALSEAVDQFCDRHYNLLNDARRVTRTIIKKLQSSQAFRDLSTLFPFEAQVIQNTGTKRSAGDPDLIIEALRDMLQVLRETDYHHSLFCNLKTVNKEATSVYLTKFSDATHRLGTYLMSGGKLEAFSGAFSEEILRRDCSVLPRQTVERMYADGIAFRSYVLGEMPEQYAAVPNDWGLAWFALRYSDDVLCDFARTGWHHQWGARLKEVVPAVTVQWPEGFAVEPTCLSDWRTFFETSSGDDFEMEDEPGLLFRLRRQFQDEECVASVTHDREARVTILLSWPDVRCSPDMVGQLQAGRTECGPLGMTLHTLADWGQVTARVRYAAPTGEDKLAIIGFRPHKLLDHHAAPSKTPGFEVVFEVVNYLHRRTVPYATATA